MFEETLNTQKMKCPPPKKEKMSKSSERGTILAEILLFIKKI
jgi:hypothetical protein